MAQLSRWFLALALVAMVLLLMLLHQESRPPECDFQTDRPQIETSERDSSSKTSPVEVSRFDGSQSSGVSVRIVSADGNLVSTRDVSVALVSTRNEGTVIIEKTTTIQGVAEFELLGDATHIAVLGFLHPPIMSPINVGEEGGRREIELKLPECGALEIRSDIAVPGDAVMSMKIVVTASLIRPDNPILELCRIDELLGSSSRVIWPIAGDFDLRVVASMTAPAKWTDWATIHASDVGLGHVQQISLFSGVHLVRATIVKTDGSPAQASDSFEIMLVGSDGETIHKAESHANDSASVYFGTSSAVGGRVRSGLIYLRSKDLTQFACRGVPADFGTRATDLGTIELAPMWPVRVSVKNKDGTPFVGLTLQARAKFGGIDISLIKRELMPFGQFELSLPAGQARIMADVPIPGRPYLRSERSIFVGPGLEPIEIVLSEGRRVSREFVLPRSVLATDLTLMVTDAKLATPLRTFDIPQNCTVMVSGCESEAVDLRLMWKRRIAIWSATEQPTYEEVPEPTKVHLSRLISSAIVRFRDEEGSAIEPGSEVRIHPEKVASFLCTVGDDGCCTILIPSEYLGEHWKVSHASGTGAMSAVQGSQDVVLAPHAELSIQFAPLHLIRGHADKDLIVELCGQSPISNVRYREPISADGVANFKMVIPGEYAIELIVEDRSSRTAMTQHRVTDHLDGDVRVVVLSGENRTHRELSVK